MTSCNTEKERGGREGEVDSGVVARLGLLTQFFLLVHYFPLTGPKKCLILRILTSELLLHMPELLRLQQTDEHQYLIRITALFHYY